jgi:ABC-type glycerol-3-phosphate transport system substrate-binding protein
MPPTPRPSIRSSALVLALAIALPAISAEPSAAATTDFPAGWTGYHTYAETVAAVAAVEAAHPTLVKRFAIGQSYQKRTIWAAKISDNVATDEAEPGSTSTA